MIVKKWILSHMTHIGVIIMLAGIAIAYLAIATPITHTVIVGEVTITKTFISILLFAVAALVLIVGGAMIVARNEANAYYNRKSFFDTLGIKKDGRPTSGRKNR